MFERIAGYSDIKEELVRIRSWILNKDIQSNPTVKLPKGILFYGRPGNGKTLFLKEYSESFDAPIINIVGNKTNTSLEVHNAFLKSKKNDFSIIIIDEIDLLIAKRGEVARTLQSEMDGVDSSKNVLVLATTNSIRSLDDALLRSGRFDRTIEVGKPNAESRKELLNFYITKLGIKGNIDTDYLSRVIHGVSCSDITAILNDVLLRCGFNAKTENVEESFYRIMDGNFNPNNSFDPTKARKEIAYHEVAHALLLHKYKQNFNFYKAAFGKECASGLTRFFPVDENDEKSEIYFQRIEISLAGYVATKLIFKRLDGGCTNDLQEARDYAVKLVNKLGLIGPECVLPWFSNDRRMETDISKRRNEKAIEKLIKRSMKSVKKYLSSHMNQIVCLGKLMMEKGFINSVDLENVMNPTKPIESSAIATSAILVSSQI